MSITDPLANMDLWTCVLAAFLPAFFAALVGLPIGRRITKDRDDAEARTRLISLVAAAFAFIVAFSTNTLWSQDLTIAQSARTVGQTSSEMLQEARKISPEFAENVRSLLRDFDQATQENDIAAGLNEASTDVNGLIAQLDSLLTESNQSTADSAAAYDAFHNAYLQYLLDLNSPSVPYLILLVVVLLGMMMAGAFASSPRTGTWTSTRTFVALSVFVIGIYQFPLWVLASRKLVLEAVHPDLSPIDANVVTRGSAVELTLGLLALVILVLFLVLVLPGLLGKKPRQSADHPAD